MNVNWRGVYPAVTTQYNDDMSINFEATQQMVDTLIKEGVDGIIAFYNQAVASRIDLSKFNLD